MSTHDHDGETAAYGECVTCCVAEMDAAHADTERLVADFDGETVSADDNDRLHGQLGRVLAALGDHGWHTLAALAARTGDPEASVSARIRDLRKAHHGGYVVDREARGGGVHEYRLRPPR